ncbi:PREDICTED: probable disease resistance protein At1g61190 [Camelina sativa]|uniref:Probable disease resistance protein At1g61190 n=1 Tax=Camelina sativa TaxID=90675 RepID=A0ABM0WMP8_CAMSA|nr:PREDICTED: probable disease resistance protein At1g61190 [Camelina sativa]
MMHDVVREMALWIASDFGKHKENFVVQARVELHEVPKVKDWGAVRRMSLMANDIEEITCSSKCSRLTTLFLQSNWKLKNLSGEFIRSMKDLAVLDLSRNSNIIELPEEMSELTSLQFLDLSGTSIKQLPVGFQELKKLMHLDLAFTNRLCSINGISKLPSLRVLKLEDSNVVHGYVSKKYYSDETRARAEVSLVKKLQLLEHLQVLTIALSTDLGLEHISGDQRLANYVNVVKMHEFQQKPLNISLLVNMENLCELRMLYTHVSEINSYTNFSESRTDSSDLYNPTSPCFTNLSLVNIIHCNGIKDLTWLLFAPNLVELRIVHSEELEEIINKEKETNITGLIPFLKLQSLSLSSLPKLESIYWCPLPFPFLRELDASYCPKLRKLPLNALSVLRVEELVISMDPREQRIDLEWEDEVTKKRFSPSFIALSQV